MRYAALVVVAVPLLCGCGGGREKKLPTTVTAGSDKGSGPAVTVPDKSEPAAVAVVERGVKAFTDGHPERLDKAKVSKVAMKGVVLRPTGPLATVRSIQAVWPDRFALTDEFNEGGPTKVLIRLRRPVLWIGRQRDGQMSPAELDAKVYEAPTAADATGRHWMTVLVPLADPRTVVFDAKKQTVNGQVWDVIKAAVPGCPVYTLWFDEKTGVLGRIDFTHHEPNRQSATLKVFTLSLHRPAGGLMPPGKVVYQEGAQVLEEWTVDAWEFPERLDDGGFDAPK